MTIFGPDISSFERGVNVRALTDPFILLKTTEGTYYVDADYAAFLAQAQASGKLAVPYHFVTTQDPDEQALFIAAHIGDKALPLMLDVEPQTQTGSRPTVAMVAALIDRCRARGLNPRLVYLPRWYWEQLGSPTLAALSGRGQGLISSAYPGGGGYPGDGAAGWLPYGGMAPLLYQYTDAAVEGGQKLGDMNAFRGTVAQLAAFLGAAASTTTTGGPMGTIPATIGQQWPEIASQFPANGTFDSDTALIWADGGARAAALYARQARDAVAALAAKVGLPVPMDPAPLAAAIVADLKAAGQITTADPAAIATAVATALEQHNLGGVSPAELGAALTAAATTLNAGGAR